MLTASVINQVPEPECKKIFLSFVKCFPRPNFKSLHSTLRNSSERSHQQIFLLMWFRLSTLWRKEKISVLRYLVVTSCYHQPIAEVVKGEEGQQFVGHKVQKSWERLEAHTAHYLSLAFYMTVMCLTVHSYPQQVEQSVTISFCLRDRATEPVFIFLFWFTSFLSCWSSPTLMAFFFVFD